MLRRVLRRLFSKTQASNDFAFLLMNLSYFWGGRGIRKENKRYERDNYINSTGAHDLRLRIAKHNLKISLFLSVLVFSSL